MQTEKLSPVVDADGHILEPADTWLKYITISSGTSEIQRNILGDAC